MVPEREVRAKLIESIEFMLSDATVHLIRDMEEGARRIVEHLKQNTDKKLPEANDLAIKAFTKMVARLTDALKTDLGRTVDQFEEGSVALECIRVVQLDWMVKTDEQEVAHETELARMRDANATERQIFFCKVHQVANRMELNVKAWQAVSQEAERLTRGE